MPGRIPKQFIDGLIARTDIVDLINSRLPLKKAGKEYQACCPFHDEKTPSFSVSRQKQFYYCFGCGAHGTVIGFLMEYDNLSYVEAIEELASRAGLAVPERGEESGPDYRPLYAMLNQAAAYYKQQLRLHQQAAKASGYLKQRGLSGEIAAQFDIGYAPPGWNNLLKTMAKSQDNLQQLQLTGMIVASDGKRYDRFRNRIMFPIRNHRGQTIGFGGRALGDDTPKYLNSPETPLFHKGRQLYGLYEAIQALRKIDQILVVEGYMDVVALAQFGVRFAVATLGTATTREHLERLFRTTQRVVFCFDGDRAGRDAGWKALTTALPMLREGRETCFLFLPDGEDPDSLIRKEGADPFLRRIKEAVHLSSFLFDKLAEQVDMASIDGRAKLAELAKPLLDQLPEGVYKEMMLNRLGEIVGLEPDRLHMPAASMKQDKPASRVKKTLRRPPLVRRAITLLLRQPDLCTLPDLPEAWRRLDWAGIDILIQLLEIIRDQPNLTTAQIIERWRGEETFSHLQKLWLMSENDPTPIDGLESEFRGALNRLSEQYLEQVRRWAIERQTRN